MQQWAMRGRNTVELRLLQLVPVFVAVLMLVLVVMAARRIVANEFSDNATARVGLAVSTYAHQISRALSLRASELELLARSAALQDSKADAARRRAELQRLKNTSPHYVWIGWIDPQGTVLAASDTLLEGVNIAQRPVFQNGRHAMWFGGFHPPVALLPEMTERGRKAPRELVDVALPVRGHDGQLRAVLAAHLDAEMFDEMRRLALGPPSDRREMALAITDDSGRVVQGHLPASLPEKPKARTRDAHEDADVHMEAGGVEYLVSRHEVFMPDGHRLLDWQVTGAQPLAAVLEPAQALQRYIYAVGGVGALLIGGFGFWFSHRLAKPYVRVFDTIAQRLDPNAEMTPAAYLGAVREQFLKLPLATLDSRLPGNALLSRVLSDVECIKTVLDRLPAPVYFIDHDYRLVYWNQSAAQIFNWHADGLFGKRVLDAITWVGDTEMKRALMLRLKTEPGPWTFDLVVKRGDGVVIQGEWRVSKVVGPDGQDVGLICKVRDLTAEAEARKRLTEQTETLSAIIQSSSDAVISTNEEGRIELFNPAAERIFERSAQSVMGQLLDTLVPARHRAEHAGHLRHFSASSTTRRRMGAGLVKGLRADGVELELEASISQVTVRGRKVLTAILRDVTERVKAERQIMQHQRELSELTHKLLVQEQETTKRLAQILHDRLGQTITAIRLSVGALSSRLATEAPPMSVSAWKESMVWCSRPSTKFARP